MCVINIYVKYAWVIPLKDKRDVTIIEVKMKKYCCIVCGNYKKFKTLRYHALPKKEKKN